jgi:hypothetical protein
VNKIVVTADAVTSLILADDVELAKIPREADGTTDFGF